MGLIALVLLGGLAWTPESHPRAEELATAQRWAAAQFAGEYTDVPAPVGITVIANHDAVQRNARNGRPMRLGDRQYTRGLYCHAPSKLVVRLPGAGTTFEAVAGVDHNENTGAGCGSVVFTVRVGEKEALRSDVMQVTTPAADVHVELAGATEFILEVGDAGDGISCDQADWADARVTLSDGRVIWLGELDLNAAPEQVPTEPLFSFVYDGRPSSDLLKMCQLERTSNPLGDHQTQFTETWTDPASGLVVRRVGVVYDDFPTIEWTLHLRNAGTADTPILSQIQALDLRLTRGGDAEFVLHHNVGSPCTAGDYQPLQTVLPPKTRKTITAAGGRPTNSDLPYFNLAWGGGGLIVVLGWPGQWAATFTRDESTGLHVVGGQELTHFKLLPGEEVRTPLVVLQFWRGDRAHAQNVWRRWMIAHNVPRPGGKLPPPHMAACSSHQFGEMINANEENQKLFVDRYVEEQLGLDYWWMDAGWYPNKTGWPNTGTWEVEPRRFPNGLRAISDHARGKGIRTIVWFEPERVTTGTWLAEAHPEWILGGALLNLGNPDARLWLTDHVDGLLKSEGIDLYRQDFNMDPLDYWRKNDAPDRQGVTEIKHVAGYLAYWDELRQRHPDLLIDTCASGGRRNDLETLRRAVPLLRSDYILEPVGQQNHTYGIAQWIPFYGTGYNQFDAYSVRSCLCPFNNMCYDMRRKDLDFAAARRLVTEWREKIAPHYAGDFYPLTTYSPAQDVWMAWQFDRPEAGGGVVQVFRRAESIYEAARLRLRGLNPDATYRLADLDRTDAGLELSGRELMETGLLVVLRAQPGSAVWTYERIGSVQ